MSGIADLGLDPERIEREVVRQIAANLMGGYEIDSGDEWYGSTRLGKKLAAEVERRMANTVNDLADLLVGENLDHYVSITTFQSTNCFAERTSQNISRVSGGARGCVPLGNSGRERKRVKTRQGDEVGAHTHEGDRPRRKTPGASSPGLCLGRTWRAVPECRRQPNQRHRGPDPQGRGAIMTDTLPAKRDEAPASPVRMWHLPETKHGRQALTQWKGNQ